MMNGEGKGFAVMTDDYEEEGIVVLIRMNEDWECEGKKEKGEIQDSPFSETPISFSKNRFARIQLIPWILAPVLTFKMATVLQKGKPMRANAA